MARLYSDGTRKRARELREQGLGYERIAARLGVSVGTIYRWLNPEYAEHQRERLDPERWRKNQRRRARIAASLAPEDSSGTGDPEGETGE